MKSSATYLLLALLTLLSSNASAQYQNQPNFQARGQGGQSQENGQGVSTDRSPRTTNALPPLPHNAPPTNEPSNAKWLGNQRPNSTAHNSANNAAYGSIDNNSINNSTGNNAIYAAPSSQVVPASVINPVAESNSSSRLRLNPPSEKRASGEGGSSTLQMLLSVGSSLMIVLGLFLGFAWFYRKTMNNSFSGLPKSVVKVLGRTHLAPRQQLMVVRFGSKLVLVSLVQGEARTLSEITDPMEVDQLAGLCESHQPNITTSFRSILHQTDRGVA